MKIIKNPQPNFERVKSAFYQTFIDSNNSAPFRIGVYMLFETVSSGRLGAHHFHDKFQIFKKDFNQWLDRVDIRSVGELIDIVKEQKRVSLPSWMKSKDYVIDYNENGYLDLVPKIYL